MVNRIVATEVDWSQNNFLRKIGGSPYENLRGSVVDAEGFGEVERGYPKAVAQALKELHSEGVVPESLLHRSYRDEIRPRLEQMAAPAKKFRRIMEESRGSV